MWADDKLVDRVGVYMDIDIQKHIDEHKGGQVFIAYINNHIEQVKESRRTGDTSEKIIYVQNKIKMRKIEYIDEDKYRQT